MTIEAIASATQIIHIRLILPIYSFNLHAVYNTGQVLGFLIISVVIHTEVA